MLTSHKDFVKIYGTDEDKKFINRKVDDDIDMIYGAVKEITESRTR